MPRPLDEIGRDLGANVFERPLSAGDPALEPYDVKAVARLDQRADLADVEADEGARELRRCHPQRDLSEAAAGRSRWAIRVSRRQSCKPGRRFENLLENGLGTLARRRIGGRPITPGGNQNMRALVDVRETEPGSVLLVVATAAGFVRRWCLHLGLDQAANQRFLVGLPSPRTVHDGARLNTASLRLLQEKLSHSQGARR